MQTNDTTAPRIARAWYPYMQVAKEYLGISPKILRAAINAGELPAYTKPYTTRPKSDARFAHRSHFVCLSDVDEWIRTHWTRPERI